MFSFFYNYGQNALDLFYIDGFYDVGYIISQAEALATLPISHRAFRPVGQKRRKG